MPARTVRFAAYGFFLICLISACSPGPPVSRAAPTSNASPTRPPATAISETLEVVQTETAAPTPTEIPRTLVICIGAEPASLYIYQSSMLVQEHVLNAVYDGPIDFVSFQPLPVILEKIPSLADGDARIAPVTVQAGDPIINSDGEPVILAEGERFLPAGCRSNGCEQVYSDGGVQMDQLSADFTLLPGLLWSDGQPLTAADSVYSFELARKTVEFSPYFSYRARVRTLQRTAAYEALSLLSTRWTGLPGFLDPEYRINFWSPLPEHAWGEFSAEELLNSETALVYPLGWGPYIIEDYRIGSHITLSRNENYFRAAEGLPAFDHLIFRFVDENSTRNIARLTSGECDVVDQDANLNDSLAELIDLDRGGFLNLEISPGTVFEHLDFGIRPAQYDDGYQPGKDRPDFFGNPLVRQAMAFCIDRKSINTALYEGLSEVYNSYVPQVHPLFNPERPIIEYNPATGRSMLEAAGWHDTDDDPSTPRTAVNVPGVPDGTPFTIRLWTTMAENRMVQAEIIRESLADCGIQAETQFWNPDEFFADGPEGPLFGRQFDLALFAWLTGERPPCEYWMTEQIPAEEGGWQGENETGYSSSAFDEACAVALTALPGEPGFAPAHVLAQDIFLQDLPIVPLVARIKLVATGPEFCGLQMDWTVNSEMWNLEEFDRDDGCGGG